MTATPTAATPTSIPVPASVPGATGIPPVPVPMVDTTATRESKESFDGAVLDYKVKRAGAYGGLAVAALLYLVGVLVVWRQMALWPLDDAPMAMGVATQSWHVFVGAMVALFSVPTVLVIAILRAASPRKDPGADSVYAALGEKLAGLIEKLLDPKK